MSYVMVDIESDGPAPGLYSLVCFGAILVTPALDRTFYGRTRPNNYDFLPDAAAGKRFQREQDVKFEDPAVVEQKVARWIAANGGKRPIFISDNNGFDWSFINYYFHRYMKK